MVSSPITSRQIKGGKVEVVTDFLFLGSKITSDGDCSQGIRRHFPLGKKAMKNLDSVLKSRDIAAVAAAAAKSLQSCPTLCDPIDGSPPGSAIPGILQARHWSGLPFPSPMHESEKSK